MAVCHSNPFGGHFECDLAVPIIDHVCSPYLGRNFFSSPLPPHSLPTPSPLPPHLAYYFPLLIATLRVGTIKIPLIISSLYTVVKIQLILA